MKSFAIAALLSAAALALGVQEGEDLYTPPAGLNTMFTREVADEAEIH